MIYQWQKEKVKFQSRVSKLKKKLEALRQVSGSAEEVDMEIKEKMQATEVAMAEMESLNQNLIAKERKSNDELQEVCKKLMDVSIAKMLYAFAFVFYYIYAST